MDKRLLLQMTADIVASHASMNELTQADLLGEIDQVFNKLAGLEWSASKKEINNGNDLEMVLLGKRQDSLSCILLFL